MTDHHPYAPGNCTCGRQWTGLAQAHCTVCHRHFGSVKGFDAHRRTGHCEDPDQITTRAGRRILRKAESPFGDLWVRDTDRVHPGAARRTAQEADA